MKHFSWDTTDRFRSNNGGGALLARILSVSSGEVKMERWHQKKPGCRTTFTLPLSYFTSPRCGWKKVGAAPKARNGGA